eukprot:4346982-Pyramimonas_sp.AAC.1
MLTQAGCESAPTHTHTHTSYFSCPREGPDYGPEGAQANNGMDRFGTPLTGFATLRVAQQWP